MSVHKRESAPPDAAADDDADAEREAAPEHELAAADGDRARLAAAVKTYDGFFSTFFVNPYTTYLARVAARLGVSPTTITLLSLAVGLAAAACFALGTRSALVSGAVLLLASFYLDGVDGTLARYTQRLSSSGAWLDSLCDRAKEYAVYAGLAVGSVRGFDEDVWLLAACALALQTARHVADVSYVTARGGPRLPPAAPDANDAGAPPGGTLRALRGSRLPVWLHRIVRFPVGERLLLVALTAALAAPRTTFVALLVWGGLATLYTVLGRLAYDHPTTRRSVRSLLG